MNLTRARTGTHDAHDMHAGKTETSLMLDGVPTAMRSDLVADVDELDNEIANALARRCRPMDHQRTSRHMTRRRLSVDNATKAKIEKLRSLEWITAEAMPEGITAKAVLECITTKAVELGLTDSSIGPARGLLPDTPEFPHPHAYDISHSKDQGDAIKRVARAQGVTEEATLRCILVAGLDMLLERAEQAEAEDNLR